MTESELGVTVTKDFRKARVDHNHADGKPFAVFMHTFYMNRWYYDGLVQFDTIAEAVKYRDQWLQGGQSCSVSFW